MSFDRLSLLESQPTTTRGTGYIDDPAFTSLTNILSARLFTLTSNITQLNRQLALVGSKKDSETARSRVNKLLDETRRGFRDVSDGLKRVKNWDDDPSPAMKYIQEKLQSQLISALADFQAAQRLCAEKTRQYVAAVKRNVHEEDPQRYTDELMTGGFEVPLVQAQAAGLSGQNEVEFQESLILQREEEIRNIERGAIEIGDIFRDLGTMVNGQEEQLGLISANVDNVAQDHKASDLELRQAHRYQKRARNRACCLLMIFAIVLTVVLLAVSV